MSETIKVVLVWDDGLALLREAIRRLQRLEERGENMQTDLDLILSDVQDETTVENSVITMLDGIAAQLKAAGTDPTKIAAIRTQIAANKTALAAAVVRNTPVPPAAAGPTVIPASVSVANGGSVQLAVDDSTGKDITATALYSSADATVASVDAAGKVSGNKVGTTTLTVTDAAGNSTPVSCTVA